MSKSQVNIGFLIPLTNNLKEDDSASKLPISEGANVFGRNDICISDKRLSRKHITLNASIDGSVDVVVEGSNPIVINSGDQRRKLYSRDKIRIADGDILELIPGHYTFKYVRSTVDKHIASSQAHKRVSYKGKGVDEGKKLVVKRQRQVSEDEALARILQMDELPPANSNERLEAIRHFSVPKEKFHLSFRLLQVQGLPPWANSSSISIGDVIQGDVLVAVLSNYMVDIDWLLSVWTTFMRETFLVDLLKACPVLSKIPHVLVIHGEGDGAVDHMKRKKPPNWSLHKPSLPISFGTHHSKAMFLVYPRGVRIVIHTANLIYVDWNNKSQGLWMQDFPWKDKKDVKKGCSFETDLIDYLSVLKWHELSVNLPSIGNVTINPSFFKKFDYRSAVVRLIASVPGYHMGPNLKKWGHMKLRTVLQECIFDKEFKNSPLVYQFSSLGSLDEKWMSELALSMSSGLSDDKMPLGLGKPLIVWPTVEDVRRSLEGYAAGSAIPSPQKNVEKEFLKKYWARWKASHTGRCRAMPHIKTFTRYNGQNLAWFLLTSANLSKAAWGALQKNNSQLMIRSYELGVLFLPSVSKDHYCGFSCTDNGDTIKDLHKSSETNTQGHRTKLVTLRWQGNQSSNSSSEVIQLPVPYELPPQPYSPEDVPWSWDRRYYKKDVYGQVWPR